MSKNRVVKITGRVSSAESLQPGKLFPLHLTLPFGERPLPECPPRIAGPVDGLENELVTVGVKFELDPDAARPSVVCRDEYVELVGSLVAEEGGQVRRHVV